MSYQNGPPPYGYQPPPAPKRGGCGKTALIGFGAVVALIAGLGVIGALAAGFDDDPGASERVAGVTEKPADQPSPAESAETTQAPAPTETPSQSNARGKAESYLEYTAFSRTGLIDQLEFEGFSEADAVYGTDALGVDWNEQAAKKAADYLEYSSFSRSGLIEQLKFEGFTQEQAEHGVSTTGL